MMRTLSPTEHQIQCTLIHWARLNARNIPELKLLHAIPNGIKTSIGVAAKAKREGMTKGVPDLHLPVPRGGYHGLWIEMKKPGGVLIP